MYKIPVPTRAEWQTLRNNAKVPKGATKVSLGDAIEKVHKTFSLSTISANIADTTKLIQAATTYAAEVAKKHPGFDKTVTDKVKKKAELHLAFVKDIMKAKTEYYPRYSAVATAYKDVKAGNGQPKTIASKLEQLRGCVDAFSLVDTKWESRGKLAKNCHVLCGSSTNLTDDDKKIMDQLLIKLNPQV
ncbi:MAG: hypothetical protein IT168_27265 [Bryobacterales bacterium]|nr:hypothetical protein [Bryobacterales bacterium]